MARYLGPRVREMRALGILLPGLSAKSIERRPYPPGQHGLQRVRKKPSSFKKQLQEKQKLRLNYGLTERQLRNLMRLARKGKRRTDETLMELLERRLDNVVFRAGFSRTIPAARQLVRHGHVLVDGSRVDIPSYRVTPGEVIGLRDRSKTMLAMLSSWESPALARPGWLEVDVGAMTARVAAAPELKSVPFDIFPQLVVEFYAKRL
jgi:small subunit ribosomal protein S4